MGSIKRHTTSLVLFAPLVALSLSSCVTRRTVTQGGRTVEKKTVIKRPLKNFIDNVEIE